MHETSCSHRPPSLGHETRALLRQYHLLPKRGLGQSFLVSPTVRDLILRAADVGPQDLVVEIGPGTGVLTEGLAEQAGRLIAIERDPGLHRLLAERLGDRPTVSLICGDALEFDFVNVCGTMCPAYTRAKLVSNLPYSVATPLILQLIPLQRYFSFLLVMVQREVAQRLLASPGEEGYSALTLRCRYEADVSAVAQVPRTAFYPKPAVDSTLVRLDLLPGPKVTVHSPGLLFRIVRAAFGQRRKMLRNALLNAGIMTEPADLDRILADAGIDPKRRGETLNLDEFAQLADRLYAMGITSPRQALPGEGDVAYS
ncbi:MAG: ribosomal RNA small subunit methyltransferase A [Candidatus Methylomirabilis oxygeniifera]|uniref:Ribosomal RNA small subunit methyltransferase A n=1 Tax=Methylomirabilis oxygeniifera TaxID=671143 RepID=D5MHU2_METO1|nr:MAG: ribosomal RNA small subunit methyltransferase A [Candidatus Methylomirabilis oxyfera]CBE69233.1 Dimethyladenosine transferase (S-adenosylmethionine-6-N', N'-adenosyl(rRNA) dimethyltransferase) (16S rRNA dimethylase) (High level kasugamycin resistance protein ksgA) (Kasugamycin dimethyltransferase) [Candidatus Methylomirabilis oxyfera]